MILNFGGWMADLLELHGCGFNYDPLNPHNMLAKLEPYLQDHHQLLKAQQKARGLAESQFSKELVIHKLARILNDQPTEDVKEFPVYTLTA
jgi:hypothetical protein